tara:strand:+ start:1532 stop:1942 length:411 start_codon:yes stop_codon:yes gene_type:complete
MKFDINTIEKNLKSVSVKLDEEEIKLKERIIEASEKDDTNQLNDTLYDILSDEELDYFKANKAYKEYISRYSKAYIEMSEYYYGPELPYDIYCKEFNKKNINETNHYLSSKKDVKELYSLFLFYGMLEYTLGEIKF